MSKRKVVKFNYENLEPCDIMICGGKGLVAYGVRLNTIGKEHRHDLKASTHTAMVVELHGRLVIVESKGGQGLKITSLKDYNGANKSRFCLGFKRIGLTTGQKSRIQKAVAKDIVDVLEYDTPGAFSFNKLFRKVFKVKQDPKRAYCSEYVRNKLRLEEINIKDGLVSPYYIQHMLIGKKVEGWRR